MVKISSIDHIVLTVKHIDATVQFYESVLGMTKESFGEGKVALKFGSQKINLHKLEEAVAHVESKGVKVIEGPVKRTGPIGAILSFYFRDPDGNLIEISNYV